MTGRLQVSGHRPDFGALHAAMQHYVEQGLLAGVSIAVLRGAEVVDAHCAGWADLAREIPLREDHIFRVFSHTKLVTLCAAMRLYEAGRFGLDDPIAHYIPQLADRQVLRPGATRADDVEPAATQVTIGQLLCHSAGFIAPLLHPDSYLSGLYAARQVASPDKSLAEAMDDFAALPLAFHPGTKWDYSLGMDVIARLCEVLSGRPFDRVLEAQVLGPLGMPDTGYVVPDAERERLAAFYQPADPATPLTGGLRPTDAAPYPGANLQPVARLSGNSGLVSTLPDMVALLRGLIPGDRALLKPKTLSLVSVNRFADGIDAAFPWLGRVTGQGFGFAGAVTMTPQPGDPDRVIGEVHWGGVAGTHWWIAPQANLAGVMLAQRMPGFWHPCYFALKRLVYDAVAAA